MRYLSETATCTIVSFDFGLFARPITLTMAFSVAQPCENPEELCISAWASSVNFFNDPAVQSALGVSGRDWTPVNTDIAYAFMESGAFGQSVILKLSALLDSGKVRVLVLNGHLDALT